MFHRCCDVLGAALLISLMAGGCRTKAPLSSEVEEQTATAVASQPPGGSDAAAPKETKLDGMADKWEGVQPVWEEAGAAGRGPFASGIDIKQVYMVNDADRLYVYFRTTPSLRARYESSPESGELCDLYFDTDNDAETGCQDVDGFDFGKIRGYEIKAWIPVGVDSRTDGAGPFVAYDLLRADEDGDFALSAPIDSQSSQEPDALIAHSDTGVEIAIPLKLLGVEAGATVRLLLKESADPFAKERYSEGTVTLR